MSKSQDKADRNRPDATDVFHTFPVRLIGELDERVEQAGRSLNYFHPYLDDLLRGILPHDLVLLTAPTGLGKCLAPETLVLKHDGSVVRADAVRVGDKLMGPDSQPRRVLSLGRGVSPMYRVVPAKGEPWICNNVHVLTLVNTSTGDVIDIGLDDYLRRSDTFKHTHKLFATAVNFPSREAMPLDPYFLGLWFGDGHKGVGSNGLHRVMVSKPDVEVRQACEEMAASFGLQVREDLAEGKCPSYRIVNDLGAGNPLLDMMRTIVGDAVTVPWRYLVASRRERLAFLAGWLDSDGSLSGGCFDFAQRRVDYADAVAFLARSLGFRVTRATKMVDGETYHRLCISGETSQIPTRIPRKQASPREQKKNALRTSFDVVPIGSGEYAGFTLDGDGRFLLGDFTVTHNTDMALSIATANALKEIRVGYFALEAEPRELERRAKFAWISAEAWRRNIDRRGELNYTDWLLHRCEDIVGSLDEEADRYFANSMNTLWTFYRGQRFGAAHLREQVLAQHKLLDMLVIDHLHYVDIDESQEEHRAMGDLIKVIRDVALDIGKPIIAVAHLRKRDARTRQLVPTFEDIQGSSNITKVCTQIITLAPASGVVDAPKWWLAPTFMAVLKDRRAGAQPFVALTMFDRRTRRYADDYTLGRMVKGGTDWEQIKPADRPGWASSFRQLELDV